MRPLFALLVPVVLAICAGCGSSAPRRTNGQGGRGASTSRASTGRVDESERKGIGGETASSARAATLRRQGSWTSSSQKVREVAPIVERESAKNGLSTDLVFGIIWVESRFNPKAVSPVGARGLMQLMPKTADYLAERIEWTGRHESFDPEFNIAAGSYYIARLIEQFDGDEDLALAAYNAGPTKIRRWMKEGGLPRVSIEYHTMVQTARTFFGGAGRGASGARDGSVIPSDDDLDRLGLAILIAGLSSDGFGLERTDDATPLD